MLGAPEGGERVVDDDLRDRDGVGPVVADRQLDRARLELRVLDGELLDRRAAALADAGRAEREERADREATSSSGTTPSTQPGRRRVAPGCTSAAVGLRGVHGQSETSKKPIQPSSVNSDWCAWNMYLPAYGKRISRIPRWPWHSITVSVSSAGVLDVPVGK